ncbi:MAG TPA: DUF4097 family beta strand repeat-containing protein [Rhodanobacter sp.]|nr:DUF4097 family beta strand repeat-containing protein [Rhodanobacter sp.]
MDIRHCLPLLLCLCLGQAFAATPIDLQHATGPAPHISISNVAGTVNVVAWDRNVVQVSGTLGDGAKPLRITGSATDLAIKVETQSGSGWFNWGGDRRMGATQLELRVPRAAALTVNCVSAALLIDGTAGGNLDIHTISGRVRLNVRTPQLKVSSISGGIELAGHAEQAELETVSGDILAPALGQTATLQTVSGRIQASGGPWRQLTLSTVSGDVQVSGDMAAAGKLGIDSMSGDVQLLLPATATGTLHASSFSGNLRSDFGVPEHAGHGPGSKLDVRLGAGHAAVTIETFSGDLRIRKGG